MARRSRDGLEKIGAGRWRARITRRDPITGRKVLDTERVIQADTRAEALAKREQLAQELAAERLGLEGPPWTVDEALQSWLATQRHSSAPARRSHARKISAAFGPRKLRDIRPPELQRWLSNLTVADTTARNILACWSRLFAHAREQGRFTGPNPVDEVTPRRTPRTSAELLADLEATAPRALLGEDLARFLGALRDRHPELYVMEVTQLLLGCRWGEVSALQWGDMDLESGAVLIKRGQYLGQLGPPKGRKVRAAALGPFGCALLREHRVNLDRELRPGRELWVFPRPLFTADPSHVLWSYGTASKMIREVRAACGLPAGVGSHALRHAFVTAARAASDDALLRQIVGHESEALTARYTSPDTARTTAFARRVEQLLGGALGGENNRNPSESQPVD